VKKSKVTFSSLPPSTPQSVSLLEFSGPGIVQEGVKMQVFPTHCGGCSHGVGGSNSLRTCLDSVSVDADFPSSFEGGILSSSALSSVRDISPSVPQVFISRVKPEMISALFASHSSSTQADSSSSVVVGSQASHLDSVQLTQSATVELSPVTRKQFLIDSCLFASVSTFCGGSLPNSCLALDFCGWQFVKL
jgi:hypothetical protein